MKLDYQKFSKIIQELIRFKSGSTKVPIRAESWEELIWATLVFMFGEKKVRWDPQSHEKSVDIKAQINGETLKISAKAGEIKRDILAISSYRLTTFDRLEEQLEFIKNQHENFNFYLICAREINEENITYYVIRATPDRLAPSWLIDKDNWIKRKSGYELKNNFDFRAKIVFKMSNQLWYSIPIDYFSPKEKLVKVSVPQASLGKGLVEFLRSKFHPNNVVIRARKPAEPKLD